MVDFTKYLKVRIDSNMPPDQINLEQAGKVVGSVINLSNEPLLSERNLSTNSVNGSGETQMGRGLLPLAGLSVAACKANLHYYASKKELAFHAHKQAIIEYEESLTALNNALARKYLKGGN